MCEGQTDRWTCGLDKFYQHRGDTGEVWFCTMSVVDPGLRLPEEQDYVQAYENVREKYKGNNDAVGVLAARPGGGCVCRVGVGGVTAPDQVHADGSGLKKAAGGGGDLNAAVKNFE